MINESLEVKGAAASASTAVAGKKPRIIVPNAKQEKAETSRAAAPFPRTTLQDALSLGDTIQQHGAGQKMRRLTIFEKLNKSPDSGPSRMMITNSSKYGITTGSYKAEFIELTPFGQKATSPDSSLHDRLSARFELAMSQIPAFKHLYESNKGKRIPSPEVMRDSLAEVQIGAEQQKECVDLFLENAKYLGLLRTSAGAERLGTIEQLLDETPRQSTSGNFAARPSTEGTGDSIKGTNVPNFAKTCFVISPIGDENSEHRKYADMVLESIIRRALEGTDLEVIRADKIGDPGMISGQVIQYLIHSALVIADLSFHNPNVFYELAIRHLVGKPTVHIIRKEDPIPFDLKDFRTIQIDTRDKYDLVAKLETYRAEIANHVRIATAGTEGTNPIRVFASNLTVAIT